jgi:hypothetical protein
LSLLRKILFVVFVGLYLGVAPLTVLYALGYIFSPVQQALLQTGLISLNTEPAQAALWLDGKPVKDKTPVILRGLEPGAYEVRLVLPRHHPWQKQIRVEAERALRLENILLFPAEPDPEILGELPVRKLWFVPGARHLLVQQGETASTLHLFSIEKKLFQPIFSQARDQDAQVEQIRLHPLGDRALVILKKAGNLEPFLVKFTEPIEVRSLADLFPEPFTELQWSPHFKDSLYYLKGGRLKRVDTERRVFYPALARRVRGFALFRRNLYLLDAKRRFLKLTEKGEIEKVLLDSPAKAKLILGPEEGGGYSVFMLNRSLAVFFSQTGKLFSNKLPYFLDEGVDQVVLAESRPRIFYRKGNRLWMVNFEEEREETFFESGPKPRWVYTGKGELSDFAPFYEDRYLLIVEDHRVLVQDVENEGNALVLLQISKRVREAALDPGEGYLYYAHPATDRLARVKLFEGRWILPRLVDELMSPSKETK